MTTTTSFIAVKHGVGCTVTAAAFAVQRSQHERVLLIDKTASNDIFAVLGLPNVEQETYHEVTEQLDVLALAPDTAPLFEHMQSYDHVVIDVGVLDAWVLADRTYLVTTACYLAARHCVASQHVQHVDGVVLVNEAGRALRAIDIETVTAKRVVAEIQRDPAIARAVDAGLFASRIPKSLARQLLTITQETHTS